MPAKQERSHSREHKHRERSHSKEHRHKDKHRHDKDTRKKDSHRHSDFKPIEIDVPRSDSGFGASSSNKPNGVKALFADPVKAVKALFADPKPTKKTPPRHSSSTKHR